MPIRPELRHFYGPEWRNVIRPRILARADDKCERCAKPNGAQIETVTGGEWMLWRLNTSMGWRNQHGNYVGLVEFDVRTIVRTVKVQIHVAHLNHVSGDDRDENLAALCQWHHFMLDQEQHHETRATRKDSARPLLAAIAS